MASSHSRHRGWLAAGTAVVVAVLTVGSMRIASATTAQGVVLTDTATRKESGFTNGTMAPFVTCTTQKPNHAEVDTVQGTKAMEFVWTSAGYDGTRMDRGAEACSHLGIRKEGWYGFNFLLPSKGFPRDKNTVIAQVFGMGGCTSWAGTLSVQQNELWFDHRGACGTPTRVRLSPNITRDRWRSVIIHFVVSRDHAGTVEVWYRNAPRTKPSYRTTGINFASFNVYSGDRMADLPNNSIALKFGMYCYDAANYTPGETRKIYFDNVSQLDGNPPNAWQLVNPRT